MTHTRNGGAGTGHPHHVQAEPTAYWEGHYGRSERVWSGRVNRVLSDIAPTLTPGRALDLGCGEGGDAIWLAQRGWRVTGIDISATAIARAKHDAEAAGVPSDRLALVAADLGLLPIEGGFDLVTASFFHSPVELARTEVLRRAAALVEHGGHLLITSHAGPPPWATEEHVSHARFLSASEEIAALDLPAEEWEIRIAEARSRPVTGPDGEAAAIDDTVVLLRRR